MLTLRLAWNDLVKNKFFSFLFILSLSLGMIGFVFIHYFKTAIETQMQAKSRDILTSDLAISSRRSLSLTEKNKIKESLIFEKSYDVKEMYSMLYFGNESKLVDLKTLPHGFPFYGFLKLLKRGDYQEAHYQNTSPWILIDQDLANLLGLRIGDMVNLGEISVRVEDIVVEDSAQTVVGFSLGPRIYLSDETLLKTQLVKVGSTIRYSTHFKFKEGEDVIAKKILDEILTDPGLRVKTHKDASEQLSNATTRFNDFLGLVSIVSLFLAGIGAQFLFRHFLLRHLRVTGLLNTLGFTRFQILRLYLLELGILSLLAFALSVIVNTLSLPMIANFIDREFHLKLLIDARILWSLVLQIFWLAPLLSIFLCLPILRSLYTLKVNQLFQGRLVFDRLPLKKTFIYFLPGVFLFYALSLWVARSWMVGSLFFVILLGAIVLIALLLQLVFHLGEKVTHRRDLFWRLPFLYLKRNRVSTLSYFLALSLGTLLITLVPTLEKTILSEIETPGQSTVPNLFLFDIQPEQLVPLEKMLAEEGKKLSFKSPLVRGRLLKINGAAYNPRKKVSWWKNSFQTREQENKEGLQNRVLNFSYRLHFSDAETIDSGVPFSGVYHWDANQPAEVSLEKRFAETYGIKLGDELSFDVQDVEVKATVVSLRTVKWMSFQPNFFIQFQPGVIDDAPKIFLGAIGGISREDGFLLQRKMGKTFNNISIIDVRESLGKITKIMDQMGVGLKIMAILCMAVGLMVIFCLSESSVFERLTSFNMFKVLGLESGKITRMVLLEFGFVSFLSALLGFLLNLLVSGILSVLMFDRFPLFPWGTMILMVLSVTFLSMIVASISIHRLMREKPVILLREVASQS